MAFKIKIISLFLIFLHITITTNATSSNSLPQPSSIYDILQTHGLPSGLFPKGISNFSIDPSNGRFEFHLSTPSPCDAMFETSVRYNWNVSGVIRYGQIAELNGIAAQELFLWLPVKGVHVDVPSSGLIYFDAGVVSKQFSLSYFETPPDCAFVVDRFEASDLSFLRSRARIVQNRPSKFAEENQQGHIWRAAS